MSLHNVPDEMKAFRQWIVWRLEWREDDPEHLKKPTKIPYCPRPGAGKASVTNPADWGTFEDVLNAPVFAHTEPCDPKSPISETGFSGWGFVFTDNDPFTGIDLDDTYGDQEAYARQLKVFREFNSYSELSPSGNGVHIIVEGRVPGQTGRRRASIEIYCRERYFTMTGNVQHHAPIAKRQDLIDILYEQMGGPPNDLVHVEDKPQVESDEDIIAKASRAENGEKFQALYSGDWSSLYGGDQSRADFALIDILAFYSPNKAQITRLFMASQLGQRDKAVKRPGYVNFMVERSFDRKLPEIDIEGHRIKLEQMLQASRVATYPNGGAGTEPGGTIPAPVIPMPDKATAAGDAYPSHDPRPASSRDQFPPGLVGDLADFILSVSPRPVPEISLAAAIGLLSGITGRAYNVSGTGLNQYILMLAMTGAGKDAISVGISKIMGAVRESVPQSKEFQGPGELVSSAGLIKWLGRHPAVISILGEFGVKLKEMASPTANAHVVGIERVLLQMYSKSGAGNVFDPMAYSDKEKNTDPLNSPSLTLLGESVPERFYEMLDESVIASGLLPRFLIFEYRGNREYLREGTELIRPPFGLVDQMASLCAHCLNLAHTGQAHNVPMTDEAAAKFREFDRWTTDTINADRTEVTAQLWNRAHLKSMKLAALLAVGINPYHPIITINETMWATSQVVDQTKRLLAKFEGGEVGLSTSGENRQRGEIYKHVGRYISQPYEAGSRYGGTPEMHRDGVVLESHIQRRVICIACFKNDRFGASNAIKRALNYMLQSDELREMPSTQMLEKYGTKSKGYVVSDPKPFVSAVAVDEAKARR